MTKPCQLFLAALFVTAVVAKPSADHPTLEQLTVSPTINPPLHSQYHPSRRKRSRTPAFLSLLSSNEVNGDSSGYVWQETRPSTTRYDLDPFWWPDEDGSSAHTKPARKLLWCGRYDEAQTWMPHTKTSLANTITTTTTTLETVHHPLRTASWSLQVDWTGKWDRTLPPHLQVEFDTDTGYCRASAPGKGVVGIGQWQVHPWGLWFSLMDASGSIEYTFTAQLHLNPFGNAAKLLQGSVLRYSIGGGGGGVSDPIQDEPMTVLTRRKWFRPVVGHFSGEGKGVANVQYAQRTMGLSQ